ncbi:MAG TPA: hypothetical protein VN794_18615 [Methylomirabilota bacterium]|nr:hypothetical protein [Methylomirabilota bacterium]
MNFSVVNDVLRIRKPYAYCTELNKLLDSGEDMDAAKDGYHDPMLRVYKDARDTIQIQIVTYGRITENWRDAKKNMRATVSLTRTEAQQLVDFLNKSILKI